MSCFLGFSFGGELAYRIAKLWQEHSGQAPTVLLGDTIMDTTTKVKKQEPSAPQTVGSDETAPRSQAPEEENHPYIEYYAKFRDEFFDRLGTLPFPPYTGKTILISATGDEYSRTPNEQAWQMLCNNLDIVHIKDSHQGLYEHSRHYPCYLTLINENADSLSCD